MKNLMFMSGQYMLHLNSLLVTLIFIEHWGKVLEYKNDHAHGHGMYYDISCGTVYQSATGKGDPEKLISLVYLTDGAPAVKSKLMNLWSIQCFVVELPPELRYCFPNILVCGLSCSPKKLDLKVFQVQIAVDGTNIGIKRISLHGHLADLVAKAPSLCFFQFNGKNGCSINFHPGERVQRGKGSIQTYP